MPFYGTDLLFTAVCDTVVSTELKGVAVKVEEANIKKDAREETIQGGKLFGHIIKFITVFRYSYSDKITAAIKAQAKRKY